MPNKQSPLTLAQILAWADDHRLLSGEWPLRTSGPVACAPAETWANINQALYKGLRGLHGGDSLPCLLARRRHRPHRQYRRQLTSHQIVLWAQAHHARTGLWPTVQSGAVFNVPGETWAGLHSALMAGSRGLPGGDSLPRLLARGDLPLLSIENILCWADAYRSRTGRWPPSNGGAILEAPGETWTAVQRALVVGCRGLPGGSSLAKLLATYRGKPYRNKPPRLTIKQILAWAAAHRLRTGQWPRATSGPVVDAPAETWPAINLALHTGFRSLPGGDSLVRLLERHGFRQKLRQHC
jgi:hypothetical protein